MWGIVSLLFGAVELIIGTRFVFQLIGANPASGFVTWIYDVSTPLVLPFTSIFGKATEPIVGTLTHSVFEPATLIALIFYALVGGILLRVLTQPRS